MKRSVTLKGHRTSITMEPEFWEVFDGICARLGKSQAAIISAIDEKRSADMAERPDNHHYSLSSAVRVFVLTEVQKMPVA